MLHFQRHLRLRFCQMLAHCKIACSKQFRMRFHTCKHTKQCKRVFEESHTGTPDTEQSGCDQFRVGIFYHTADSYRRTSQVNECLCIKSDVLRELELIDDFAELKCCRRVCRRLTDG